MCWCCTFSFNCLFNASTNLQEVIILHLNYTTSRSAYSSTTPHRSQPTPQLHHIKVSLHLNYTTTKSAYTSTAPHQSQPTPQLHHIKVSLHLNYTTSKSAYTSTTPPQSHLPSYTSTTQHQTSKVIYLNLATLRCKFYFKLHTLYNECNIVFSLLPSMHNYIQKLSAMVKVTEKGE